MKLATALVLKARPSSSIVVGRHAHAVEPEQLGQGLGDLVHDPHRPALVGLELVDDADLALELGLLGLVVLDLLDDLRELVDLRLRGRDLLVLLLDLAARGTTRSRRRPAGRAAGRPASSHCAEVAAAASAEPALGLADDAGRLPSASRLILIIALVPHLADARAPPPPPASARSTAASRRRSRSPCTGSRRSGFISSVGTPKRSRSTCCRLGVSAQPPESTSSSTGPSRRGGGEEVEGLLDLRRHLGRDRVEHRPRVRRRSSGPPARRASGASACSKERLNSRCSASVNWLPPNEMSRQKTVWPRARMLMLVTSAPMLTSATTLRGSRS